MAEFVFSAEFDGSSLERGLLESLKRVESTAADSGAKVGETWTKAATSKTKFTEAVEGQFKDTQQVAGKAGASAGEQYSKDAGRTLKSGLLAQLPEGWVQGTVVAGKEGDKAGLIFATKAGDGVTGKLPGSFATAFKEGQGIAAGAGGAAGTAFGDQAGKAISAKQDLFQALVIQADKAAKDVGLIFNKVDLTFRVPDGGVLPSGVLDQLRQADAQFDNVVTRLGEFSVAADAGRVAGEELGAGIDEIGRGASLMDGIIQGVAFSLANTLTNAAGQAVGALGAAVGTFSALDSEIRLAAAAAGEDGAYDKLGATISQVGIEAAGSTLEVAKLSTELLRGGMSVDEANASLGAIVRGAEATGTAYAQMGSVVTATIKGFGLEATDAQRVVDALTQGANSSAASVGGMGNAFKYAAPVAKILGLSVEDVATATGLMTNAGIDAAEAGVTLRNGLSKLASAAPQTGEGVQKLTGQSAMAADAMKQLGVDIYNTDGTLKPMEDTLLQLKGAFDLLDPASKIRLAANLFGGEDDGTKWLALLNQSEEEIKRMSLAMANTQGATDKARDAMEGWQLKTQALQGTIEKLVGDVGRVIATALLPFLEATNFIVGAIGNLPGPIKDTVVALALMGGAFVAAVTAAAALQAALKTTIVLETIAQYKTLSAGLVSVASTVIPSLITAIKALWVAMSTTTIASVAGQLGTLVAGLASVAASIPAVVASSLAAVGGFQGMAVAAGKFLVASAPLIALAAAVAANLYVWNEATSEATKVTQQLTPETGALAKKMEELGQAQDVASKSSRNLLAELPGISHWLKSIEEAKTSRAVAEMSDRMNDFQASTTVAQNKAAALLAEVQKAPKAAGALAEFTGRIKETRELLVAAEADTKKYIGSLQQLAAAAKAAGNKELAEEYERRATALKADLGLTQLRIKQIDEEVKANGQLEAAMKKVGKSAEELTKWREEMEKQGVLDTLKLEAEAHTEVANRLTTQEAAQIKLRDATLDSIKAQMDALGQQLAQQSEAALNDKENAENRKRYAELSKQYAEEQAKLTGEIIAAEKELNQVIAEAPVRDLTASLEFGAKLTEFAKAASDFEQARFNTAKARNDYELKKAEERGASEQEIAAIRERGEQISRDALLARAKALEVQIGIEKRSLEISQQKALIEANLKVNEARIKLMEQEVAFQQALLTNNPQLIALEANKLQIARESLGLTTNSLGLIQQTIPLEQQTLALRQGAAAEALKAEGAAKGMNIQIAGVIAPLGNANTLAAQYAGQWVAATKNLTGMGQAITTSTGYVDAFGQRVNVAAGNVATIATEAGTARFALQQAADGSVRISQVFGEAAKSAGSLSGQIEQATGATQGLVTQAGRVPDGLDEAVRQAQSMGYEISRSQAEAILAAQATGSIGAEAKGAAGQVQGVATQASGIQDPLRKAIAEMVAAQQESERWRAKAKEVEAQFGTVKTAVGQVTGKVEEVKTATDAIQQSPLEKFFLSVAIGGLGPVEQALIRSQGEAMNLASEEKVGLIEYFGNVAEAINSKIGGAINAMIKKAQDLAKLLFGGKWAGGDVAAGSSWTVNEFGQESFLSSSGLSLINRPAYGQWTAPSKGLVIPAGITSELKAAGAFDRGAGPVAAMAGKLGAAAPAGSSSHTVNHVTIAAAEPTDAAARLMMNVARIRARGRRF